MGLDKDIERAKRFLVDYAKICMKHGYCIGACGCYESPWLLRLDDDIKSMPDIVESSVCNEVHHLIFEYLRDECGLEGDKLREEAKQLTKEIMEQAKRKLENKGLVNCFMKHLYLWVKAKQAGDEQQARKIADEVTSLLALIKDLCKWIEGHMDTQDPVKYTAMFIVHYYEGEEIDDGKIFEVLEQLAEEKGWKAIEK